MTLLVHLLLAYILGYGRGVKDGAAHEKTKRRKDFTV